MALIYYYVTPLLVAGIIASVLAVVAARRSSAPGATLLCTLMVASAIWAFGYALELWAPSYAAKLFWGKVQYLGIVVVAPAWLVFSVQFARQNRWLCGDVRGLGLLGAIPAVTLLLVWTNEAHGLVWQSAVLATDGPFPMLILEHGPWFWVFTLYSYTLLMIGTAWVVGMLLRSTGIVRKQAAAVLVGMIPVWLANAIYLGARDWPILAGLDLTPFGLTLMGIVCAWSLWCLRLMEIVPVAHSTIIHSLADGVIVLDLHNRIIEMNGSTTE